MSELLQWMWYYSLGASFVLGFSFCNNVFVKAEVTARGSAPYFNKLFHFILGLVIAIAWPALVIAAIVHLFLDEAPYK